MRYRVEDVVIAAGSSLAAIVVLRITGLLDCAFPVLVIASIGIGIVFGGLIMLFKLWGSKAKERRQIPP
jgi:hypothetical protein